MKWALTLVVVLLSVIAPAAASANSWTSTADMPYYQWGGAAGITIVGDHIVLAGGFGFDRNRVYAGLRSVFLGGDNAGADRVAARSTAAGERPRRDWR